MKSVFILGIGSDIGKALAERYLSEGCAVAGTYRHRSSVRGFVSKHDIRVFECELSDKNSIAEFIKKYKRSAAPWDIFISCVGSMEPIGKFFECDFDRWEGAVITNSLAQLRILREIYPYRRKKRLCHVAFFAGGGTNNPFSNYSAYCASKILLIKMCELLDDENRDLNAFIIGPGWVRTKIHDQTISSRSSAGGNYSRTLEFLNSDQPGTSHDDIYDCINWCIEKGKCVSGGRNFSVVHDKWKGGGRRLSRQLRGDVNKFKLRRFKNK